MIINEEGEPTNSVNAGSMDSHDASDGKKCKNDTKIMSRKGKKKKFKEYLEYLEDADEYYEPDTSNETIYDLEDEWYDLEFEDELILITHITNLEISADDYEIFDDGVAQFRNEKDIDAIERLMYHDK